MKSAHLFLCFAKKKKKKERKASLGIGWVQPQLLFVYRKWVCNLETLSTLSTLNGEVSETDTRIPRRFTSLRFAQKDRKQNKTRFGLLSRGLVTLSTKGAGQHAPPAPTKQSLNGLKGLPEKLEVQTT